MDGPDEYGRIVLEAADRAGLGVVLAHLVPPKLLHVNASAAAIFGVSMDELLARAPLDFVAPEQRGLVADRLQRRLAGETPPPADITIIKGDGSRAVIACQIANLTIAGVPSAAIFVSPASDRVTDLAADARYRQLVDAAPDGVAISRDARFLYANRAALDLIGCKSAEDLRHFSLTDLLYPEDLKVVRERTIAMMRGETHFPPRDYRVPGRDLVVEVRSMLIEFEGGPAVLAFVRDVTEARRVQAELERAHRLTALGTLVAGIAHEVNNPLSFASMGAEILNRFFDSGARDFAGGRVALTNIISGLDRIAGLVRELRSFVRAEEAAVGPVDVGDVLAGALRMTSPQIRQRARIDVDLPALPLIRGSAARLEQVFVNLLINAGQAFGEDASRNLVRLRGASSAGEVVITIEDNGAGIHPSHLPKVFDPFFTTKETGEGMGLGLAICHAIVNQHLGRIDLVSEVGGGTVVKVILPTEPSFSAPAPVPPPPTPQLAPRTRVLIVDDEAAIGRTLRELLQPSCEVTVATSGFEADRLLAADAPPYDVVLCDLAMPDLSGMALFDRTAARSPTLAARFIFMTGDPFNQDLMARRDSQSLTKPFSVAEVTAAIGRVLGGA